MRNKVNKIIRLLIAEDDDYWSESTLDTIIDIIEKRNIEQYEEFDG